MQKENFNFHMFGLFINDRKGILGEKLKILQEARAIGNKKIIEKLNAHGYKIDLEELKDPTGEQLGRPHIDYLLHKKGYFYLQWNHLKNA